MLILTIAKSVTLYYKTYELHKLMGRIIPHDQLGVVLDLL